MSDLITVVGYFDGICEAAYPGGPRNPGGCSCGGWWVEPFVLEGTNVNIAGQRHYCTGDGATNNAAEYGAAIDCLRALYGAGYRGAVLLRGDSQLVVKQYSGEWACHKEHLRALRDKLRHGATFFASVRLEWIPREQNQRADALSRRAHEQETGLVAPC
jgi:ribonuclease HI